MTLLARLFGRSKAAPAPAKRRSFDAAGQGDRWPSSSVMGAPNTQSLAAAGPVAMRAEWLAANSATAAAFVSLWTEHLVATGPNLRAAHPDPAMRRLLEKKWNAFCRACDAEGYGDLAGVLAKVARSLVIHGEAFVQLVIVDRRLRLKVISAEQVARDWTRVLDGGNRVFSGVEVDANGRRVAYWIYPQPFDLPWSSAAQPERVSADDLLHCFEAKFAGAVRGMSWLAPIAANLLELDKLNDALLARANVAALFAGFVRDIDGNASGFTQEIAQGRTGKPELSMEPGTVRILPPGCDIEFPTLPDNNGTNEFVAHLLRTIAVGGGVPSFLLSGDLSQVNYSSAKIGLESFKRSINRTQQSLFVAQLLQPIWERFLSVEILSGRLGAPDFERDPESYVAVEFRWPAWASLDPLKDESANEIALRNRTKSRAQIIAAQGRDIEDVDQELEHDPFTPPQASPKAVHHQSEDSEDA